MPITAGVLVKLRAVSIDKALLAAIGCAASVATTSPSVTRMFMACDNMLYGRPSGSSEFSLLIGEYYDVMSALLRLIALAGLTDAERDSVLAAFDDVIEREAEPAVKLWRCPGRARFTEV